MHVRLTQSNIGAKGEQQKQNTTNGEGKYICVSVLREDRIKRLHCGDRPSLMLIENKAQSKVKHSLKSSNRNKKNPL